MPSSPKSVRKVRRALPEQDGLHLAAIYQQAPIGIVECSPEGVHVNVNVEFCRITGYEREELLARSIKDISYRDDYVNESKLYAQLLLGEVPSYKIEKRYERKDGEIIWVEVIRSAVRDALGRTLYTLGIVQDITERRQAEAQIRFQAHLLENVHDAIIATDEKLHITSWNRAAEELYGWTAKEVLGRSLQEVTQSELTAAQRSSLALQEKLAKENASNVEQIHHHRDGQALQVEARSITLRGQNRQVSGYVTSIRDISRRKRAEKALLKSEERMRRSFEIETVGIIFFDPHGAITDANKAFLGMSGYTRDDLQKGLVRWEVMTPEEFMQDSHKAIHELVTRGETTPYEKQYIRKDGRRWWGLFAAKLLSENEAVEFILDITERKQAEEALRELNLQLESHVQNRTAELQTANQDLMESHGRMQVLSQRLVQVQEEERRTIARELHDRVGQTLSALNINLLVMNSQLPDDVKQDFGSRFDDSIKLVAETISLVRNLMSELRPAEIDDYGLDVALKAYIHEYGSRFGIKVIFDPANQRMPQVEPGLQMTVLRIAQEALMNVARHAQASEVLVRVDYKENTVHLTIEDNGIGIRARQDANRPGSHGLKIMRERAEAFGGTFTIGDSRNGGTKLVAIIPIEETPKM